MKKSYFYCSFSKSRSPFYGYKAFFIIPMLVTSCTICLFYNSLQNQSTNTSLIFWILASIVLTSIHFYLYYNELKHNLSSIITYDGIIVANFSVVYLISWHNISSINKPCDASKINQSSIALDVNSNDETTVNIKNQYRIVSSKAKTEKIYNIINERLNMTTIKTEGSMHIKKLGNINLLKYLAPTIVFQTLFWNTISAFICVIFDVFRLIV